MVEHYKIRRKSDGFFSEGGQGGWKGAYIKFSKKGKTWTTRGAVSNHFAQFNATKDIPTYKDCEIVVYEVNPIEVMSYPVSDWALADSTIRQKELDEQRAKEYVARSKEKEKAELLKRLAELNK
jgi:hypothetical protein